MAPTMIDVQDLTVAYGDTIAVETFSLTVPASSLVAIVGPSGCGKTTALRAIAGFERPAAGTVTIRDRVVFDGAIDVPPEKRRVGMVFQEFALFPHITVAENVGYGVHGADRVERVASTLDLVGLGGYGSRFPHELSGGEQQRVALARALAPEPDVVLLDEPFSSLDAPQRERMRRELKRIIRATGVTALFVTHDQAEALAIADHIAIMRDGTVVQAGAPDDVYASPRSPWIGTFLGDATIFEGVVAGGAIDTSVGRIRTDVADGTSVSVLVRPEWVVPSIDLSGDCTVVDREFYGHDQRVSVAVPGGETVDALVGGRQSIRVGDRVSVAVSDAIVFAPDTV